MLRNTTTTFGTLTKSLHWLLFILLTIQLGCTWFIAITDQGSVKKSQYVLLHKSLGVTIFIVATAFALWKTLGTSPQPAEADPRWKRLIAKIVQHSIFLLLIIIPLLGYSLSCTNGRIVRYFELFSLPCLMEKNEVMASFLYTIHVTFGFILFGLIGLHILAALQHHFILKDSILKRMLP